jgi:hypothetical protein
MRSVSASVLVLGLFALGCTDRTSPTSETTEFEDSDATGFEGADATAGDAASWYGDGDKVFGVDAENHLVVFSIRQPGYVSRRVRITGTGGQKVVGIDFRPSAVPPATPAVIGKLYGITKNKIYEIDPKTGYASNGQPLTVPLVGAFFGTGFNPTVDRLRSHGNTAQNVRLSVDNGMATQDTSLAYAAGDPGFGQDPSIAGTAYTNSDNNPLTGTVLYAIDARRDALVVLPSPNGGQLTTVGRLGARTTNFVGFDIPGDVQIVKRFGYASLTTPDRWYDKWYWGGKRGRGGSTLYKVDLDTGAARLIGDIGNRAPLVGIALAP